MNFDLSQLAPREIYKLITGVVVPRPIALVTSRDESGVLNAAPFSYFNLVGSEPPLVALGLAFKSEASPKDTARHIRASGEFVVNLVSEAMVDAMNVCAIEFPPNVSEVEAAGLTTAPSQRIETPRLGETPAALECVERATLLMGRNRIVIGEIVGLYLADERVDAANFHVDTPGLRLIGRMGGGSGAYLHTQDTFELARLSYDEWRRENNP